MRSFLNETVSNSSITGWASIRKRNYLNNQLKLLVFWSQRNLKWVKIGHISSIVCIHNNYVRHSRQQFCCQSSFFWRISLAGCAGIIACDLLNSVHDESCKGTWSLDGKTVLLPLVAHLRGYHLQLTGKSDTKVDTCWGDHPVTTWSWHF